MKKVNKLLAISLIAILLGGGATYLNFNSSNQKIKSADAIDVSTNVNRLEIELMNITNANYKAIVNPRFHIYNIKTYFDDNNSINSDIRAYETNDTRRVIFKDNGDVKFNGGNAYAWYFENGNKFEPLGSWPGTNLVHQIDDYYVVDVSKKVEHIIFNGNNKQTSDLKLSDALDEFTTYDNKSSSWVKNDPKVFKDNNSKYYFENVNDVYHIDGIGAKVMNKIDNGGDAPKFETLNFVNSKTISFPAFIKSFDIDLVGTIDRGNKGKYLVQLKQPFHIEDNKNTPSKYKMTFSLNGGDAWVDDYNKVEKINGYLLKAKGSSSVIKGQDVAYYKFLDKYFTTIKHSNYKNDAYSICNSLLDSNNKDNLINLISLYKTGDVNKQTYISNHLNYLVDKYENKNSISINQTMNYISSFVSVNMPNNPVNNSLGGNFNNNHAYTVMIITSALVLAVSFIVFIIKHKAKLN